MHLFERFDDHAEAGPAGGPEPASPESAERAGQLASLLEMVAAAELSLVDVLRHLAEEASSGLPEGAGVVVAARRPDGRRELVASTGAARAVDALQLGLREGPLLDCTVERHQVASPDLTGDERWPRLAGSAGAVDGGMRSALCVPLVVDGVPLGTLSAYAPVEQAFDERAGRRLVRLAAAAGPPVADVLVLDQARRLTFQLHLQGSDRGAVDEAIGVLMEENGVGTEEALAVLQMLGRTEHEDLAVVARAIVAGRAAEQRPG